MLVSSVLAEGIAVMPESKPRRRFRYSLRSLLIVVVLLGLCCAALANPSRYWAVAVYLSTLAVFPAAAWLGRVRETTRPFALGFAITGFLYFSVCHLLVVYGEPEMDLPTSRLLCSLQNVCLQTT